MPNENLDLQKLNELCNYTLPDSICNTYDDVYKNKGYIYGMGGGINSWEIFIKPIFEVINNDSPQYKSFTITNDEQIYIYNYESVRDTNYLLKSITVNDIPYNICSAVIGAYPEDASKPTHSICGIKTNDHYFLYDSNNVWIEENWELLLDGKMHKLPKLNELINENVNYQIGYIVYKKT